MDWFQIKQVSMETGLSQQLIRKWEQRYGAVHPKRLENGYRLYSASDVARLKQIKALVDTGTPVHQAVQNIFNRNSDTLSDLSLGLSPDLSSQSSATPSHMESVVKLIEAGTEGDLRKIEAVLRQDYVAYGLRSLIQHVVIPFLYKVGELWQQGVWSEDQEHLSTLTIRNFLVRRAADLPDAPLGAPMFLASCAPAERHDIILNIALVEARRLGFNTAFLGQAPAPSALEQAVSRLHPNLVLLSVSTPHPDEEKAMLHDWFHTIDAVANETPRTEFYVGGPQAVVGDYTAGLSHLHAISSIEEVYEVLENYTGHKHRRRL